jgi:hypothetical protein
MLNKLFASITVLLLYGCATRPSCKQAASEIESLIIADVIRHELPPVLAGFPDAVICVRGTDQVLRRVQSQLPNGKQLQLHSEKHYDSNTGPTGPVICVGASHIVFQPSKHQSQTILEHAHSDTVDALASGGYHISSLAGKVIAFGLKREDNKWRIVIKRELGIY